MYDATAARSITTAILERATRRWMALAVLSVALAACDRAEVALYDDRDGSIGGEDAASFPDLVRLTIDPPSATFTAGGHVALAPSQFRALGTFPDGERDLTTSATWTLDDPALGTIEAGLFTAAGHIGGMTTVRAKIDTHEATATVTIFLDVEALAPNTPPGTPDLFPDDLTGDRPGGRLIYPATETMFPLNALRTHFQWHAPAEHDLFELRFESSIATVRWYTTDRAFLLDGPARDWIALSHAGRALSVTVRSTVSTSTGTVYRSDPILIEYARAEVTGSIYYWSTGTKAIMRASLESANAEKFYPAEGDDTCAACHTVSRDGRKMALGYGGEKLRVASIPDRATLLPAAPLTEQRDYAWGTFSPDGTKLLVAVKGKLELYDVGARASEPIALPPNTFATHPDWSPDGTHVAFALTREAPGNKDVKGSSLARMPVLAGGTFGAIELLLESTSDDETFAYPAHSPDSRWIAFIATRGKSKDSKPAELRLIRADGSTPPIQLERLNRRVGPDDDVRSIGNTMPTWAPSTLPGVDWIAFSSIRDYGDILTGVDRDQLWVAAIELDRAASGGDPSRPAFWLPFQALEEGNHRAFWSRNPDDECPSTFERCNGIDDDCNAIVDDACCTAVPEICGNGADDDCDGSTDEACGCMPLEVCANGDDDDCDGLIDIDDEDCSV